MESPVDLHATPEAALPGGPPETPDEVFVFPASYAQQRLVFLDRLLPGSPAYNLYSAVRLRGRLDLAALRRTLAEVVRRHESLRTTFSLLDGETVQVIAPGLALPLPLADLAALPPEDRSRELARLSAAEALRPFDLRRGPLLRVTLVRLSDGEGPPEHALLFNLHHAVGDAWSLGVLIREVAALYAAFSRGERPPLPELALQYADYAESQREWLDGPAGERQLAWWREQLAGLEPLDLPADRPRPPVRGSRGVRRSRVLPATVAASLRQLARERGTTLFAVLLSGLQALLHRYTGSTDFAVGTAVAGRNHVDTEPMIGCFVNTLVLRAGPEGRLPFSGLVERSHAVVLDALAHQDLPFERLVQELQPRRDLARNPLFDVLFNLQSAPSGALTLPGLTLEPVEDVGEATAKLDWLLDAAETGEGLLLALELSADLFEAPTAERALGHLERLLAGAGAVPATALEDLPLLSAAELHQLTLEAPENSAATGTPASSRRLHELFEEQAGRTPERTALIAGSERLTYAGLDARATALARRLAALGAGPERVVGVCLPRNAELIVALLAVLKSGAAYLPLDPAYPEGRLALMLEDSGAAVLIAGSGAPEGLLGRLPTVTPNAGPGETDAAPLPPGTAGNLAYLIYTSGSTGRPKGVAIEHRAAVQLVVWAREAFASEELAGVLASTSASFDLSVFEIFTPLAASGAVILAENALALPGLPAAGEVTLVNTVPSAAAALLDLGPLPPRVRAVSLAGEALRRALVERLYAGGAGRVLNLYGPSEDTTYSTGLEVAKGEPGEPPIGRPVAGSRSYVLDAGLRPLPVGVPGELALGGAGLARGYVGDPARTAERFVPDALSGASGRRLYRTGDRARWRPDGHLDFLGRLDHQVKLRGFRVEPGEVEAALTRHPGVDAAVITLREDARGDRFLAAYLVPRDGMLAIPELRAFLLERLPEHMVPAVFVSLPALPLTANGKVDRRALPAPGSGRPETGAAYEPPRTAAERELAELWAEVLSLDRVGVHDDFFALGGDSIRGLRAVALAERRGLSFSLQQLFRRPCLADLAELAAPTPAGAPVPRRTAPFELVPEEDRRRLPAGLDDAYPLARLQAGMLYHSEHRPGSTLYHNVQSAELEAPLDLPALRDAVAALLARHPVLRTSFDRVTFREPLQLVWSRIEPPFAVVDLSALPAAAQRQAVSDWTAAERAARFDPARPPLVRFAVLPLGPRRFRFGWTNHHALLDGWSVARMLAELFQLYLSRLGLQPGPGPAPEAAFRDFVALERQALESPEDRDFWRDRLAGRPDAALPRWGTRSEPDGTAARQDSLAVPLPPEVAAGLEAASRAAGIPPKGLLLAVHLEVLARATGSAAVVSGIPSHGRPETADGDQVLGLFLNTLPLALRLQPGSWADLARQALAAEAEMLPHRRFPMAEIQRELGGAPLYEAAFNYTHFHALAGISGGGAGVRVVDEDELAENDYPLLAAFQHEPAGSGVALTLAWDPGRFPAAQVQALAGRYARTLVAAAADPAAPRERVPLLGEGERHQLLREWNDTASGFPRDAGLAGLFLRQARRDPEAVAVRYGDEELSYAELERRSAHLAGHLLAAGVGPGTAVALALERSAGLIVAMLAVVRAGGFYVPLDPADPAERLDWIVRDSGARVVVGKAPSPTLPRYAGEGAPAPLPIHLVPGRAEGALSRASARGRVGEGALSPDQRLDHATGDFPAYRIYTSGSTGQPKGIEVPQRAVARLVLGADYARLGPDDRVAQASTTVFDAATFEIWGALLNGATLVGIPRDTALSPRRLAETLRDERVTALFLTTPLFHRTVRAHPAAFAGLTHLLVGGEVMDPEAVRALLAQGPPRRFANVYGPTETTTFASWHRLSAPPEGDEPIPIGRPIAATRLYAVDPDLRPLPVGAVGELAIGGDGLALGYPGRPALTAEKFVPDPFGEEPGGRLYRTGDRVRQRPDGAVEFLGRLDRQVKLRGFRIEPDEIEAALVLHPAVEAAAVVVAEAGPGDRRLVAFLAPRTGATLDTDDVRRHLEARLPAFMVPALLMTVDRIPLTPGGKLDRRALPAVDWDRGRASAAYEPPRGTVEEILAGLWRQVLRAARVGRHDDFFELGGYSLAATELVSRIRQAFAVDLPIRALFESPTVAELGREVERALRADRRELPPPIVPRVAAPGEPRPLSFAQQRMWLIDQLFPGGSVYNVPLAVDLVGELSVSALQAALGEVVRRHEVLRTTFGTERGEPFQVVREDAELPLPVVDLSGVDVGGGDEARRLGAEEAARPFDLTTGPVLRTALLRLAPDRHRLLATAHHIAADGWSMEILTREVAVSYAAAVSGTPADLPALPVTYADFAEWQRGWLSGAVLDAELAFWRERLAGAPPLLPLPADRPRPAVASQRAGWVPIDLGRPLSAAVTALGRAQGATPFMVLLAAFQALLGRVTGEARPPVGTPVAGRNHLEIEGLIGFFVNTLVLVGELSDGPAFRELVERARRAALEAHAHQDLPFEKLVEELDPRRSLSHSPLFQVVLAFQNLRQAEVEVPGLHIAATESAGGGAKFDLTLILDEHGGSVAGALEYAADLFDHPTAVRLAGWLQTLLAAAVERPETSFRELPLLSEVEAQQALREWNDTAVPAGPRRCLHELVSAQAARTPDALALRSGGERLTYAELDALTDRVARRLRAEGVAPEVPVGVRFERSVELVAAILGVLKAGGFYLPLDPALPRDRAALLLRDSGARHLLTQEWLEDPLPEDTGLARIHLNSIWDAEWEDDGSAQPPLEPWAVPENLAYVIYTSGSTGVPKGVAIPHVNAAILLEWAAEVFPPSDLSVVLGSTSVGFDMSVFEIFMTLGVHGQGGTLVVVENALDLLGLGPGAGITLVNTVPSAFAELVRAGGVPPTVRTANLGGEPIPPALIEETFRRTQVERILNLYGPTEDTTYSTCAVLRPGHTGIPAVGRPVSGGRGIVVDREMRPVPPGVAGELFLSGSGLARGYFGRPALTAERFLPDPQAAENGTPGGRAYRTGDLIRHRPDGQLDYLGRLDFQVKIRGFRVEPGEVEAALARHPEVREAAVAVREGPGGEKRLVAWTVPAGAQVPAAADLRAWVGAHLPEYMVPAAFHTVAEMPLGNTGKVNRQALVEAREAGTGPSAAHRTAVPPRDLVELALVRIWEEVLETQPVGVEDNFFESGGHSLLAVRLMVRIRERFGRELPLAILFQTGTVERLAAVLRRGDAGDAGSRGPRGALVPIQEPAESAPASRPFFCVHPAGGNVLCYLDLARALGPGQPFYGLQYPDPEETGGRPLAGLEEMAAHYVAAVRQVQPQGPYRLGGWSLGALIAFEMARQIAAADGPGAVELTALIDPPAARADLSWGEREEAELLAWFARDLAAMQGQQVEVSADELRAIPAEDRLERMLESAREAGLLPPELDLDEARHLFDVFQSVQTTLRGSPVQPGPVHATVFQAGGLPEGVTDPTGGWGELALGGTEVEVLPADHYSVVRAPHVEALASRLRARLQSTNRPEEPA